uniref:Ras and EF-hand domain-containing protein n=2 Tax=Clastoptera arizonana TaxID=38151 RepID=A0A1B6DVN7_9HEMI
MEEETLELQTHLRLFQKVNSVLLQGKEKCKNITDETDTENRELRMMLADTKTNLAMLHSEMAQLRADYEKKCQELNNHIVTVTQYQEENNQVHQKLALMQEVNYKLQDTNDSLLSVMDSGQRTSPIICSPPSSLELEIEEQRKPKWIISNYRSPSPGNILHETQISNARFSPFTVPVANQFNIPNQLDDYDSGRSTIRDPVDYDTDINYVESSRISDAEYQHISLDNYPTPSLLNRGLSFSSSVSMCELECNGPPDRTYKIVFAGDAAVGKSCFIHRFCKGTFTLKLGSTLGVDFQIKTFRIDNKNIVLQLWDTAGQERFRSMTKTYFRRADGVLLLFDVNNEKSFLSIQNWIQSIDEITEKSIPIYVCGNKVDLRPESLQQGITCVREEDGERIARENGATYFETSSKTGLNITNALIGITRDMLAKEDVEVQTSVLAIKNTPAKRPCCK